MYRGAASACVKYNIRRKLGEEYERSEVPRVRRKRVIAIKISVRRDTRPLTDQIIAEILTVSRARTYTTHMYTYTRMRAGVPTFAQEIKIRV